MSPDQSTWWTSLLSFGDTADSHDVWTENRHKSVGLHVFRPRILILGNSLHRKCCRIILNRGNSPGFRIIRVHVVCLGIGTRNRKSLAWVESGGGRVEELPLCSHYISSESRYSEESNVQYYSPRLGIIFSLITVRVQASNIVRDLLSFSMIGLGTQELFPFPSPGTIIVRHWASNMCSGHPRMGFPQEAIWVSSMRNLRREWNENIGLLTRLKNAFITMFYCRC